MYHLFTQTNESVNITQPKCVHALSTMRDYMTTFFSHHQKKIVLGYFKGFYDIFILEKYDTIVYSLLPCK